MLIPLDLRPSPCSIDIYNRQRIGSPVWIKHHGWFVRVLPEVQLQAVAVLGRVVAVGTSVLVGGDVGLHVRVEHGLVNAGVAAVGAPEGLRPEVVPKVVLQVVLVLRHEGALGAGQKLFRLDVTLAVLPEILLGDSDKLALLALERLHLALRVDPRDANLAMT